MLGILHTYKLNHHIYFKMNASNVIICTLYYSCGLQEIWIPLLLFRSRYLWATFLREFTALYYPLLLYGSLWKNTTKQQTQSLTSDTSQVKDFKELLKIWETFTFIQCENTIIGRLKCLFTFRLKDLKRTKKKAKHSFVP